MASARPDMMEYGLSVSKCLLPKPLPGSAGFPNASVLSKLFNTVQCCGFSAVQHSLLPGTAHRCSAPFSAGQYCNILYLIAQHCSASLNTVQYCSGPLKAVQYMYRPILFDTVQYHSDPSIPYTTTQELRSTLKYSTSFSSIVQAR